MPAFEVSISVGDMLVWHARLNARDRRDARLKAIALMESGGGYRPPIREKLRGARTVLVELAREAVEPRPRLHTPAELARRCGASERRIREKARETGACSFVGRRMLIKDPKVAELLQALLHKAK
jgi:hypothetical protein